MLPRSSAERLVDQRLLLGPEVLGAEIVEDVVRVLGAERGGDRVIGRNRVEGVGLHRAERDAVHQHVADEVARVGLDGEGLAGAARHRDRAAGDDAAVGAGRSGDGKGTAGADSGCTGSRLDAGGRLVRSVRDKDRIVRRANGRQGRQVARGGSQG